MTTRATISLPTPLYDQLVQYADQADQTLSGFVRDLVANELKRREAAKTQEAYEIMNELQGIITDPALTNLSEEVDEVLYGEYGAWRGENE